MKIRVQVHGGCYGKYRIFVEFVLWIYAFMNKLIWKFMEDIELKILRDESGPLLRFLWFHATEFD